MKTFTELLESTYAELQSMGYEMTTQKSDGKQASHRGKNYSKGYWNKKLEDAIAAKDKLGIRYAKMEIAKLNKKPEISEATEFPNKKTRDDVDFYTKKKLKKTGTPNVKTMN